MSEKLKKKMGRHRKEEGRISSGVFARAGILMSLYDGEREKGQKHSEAVKDTVGLAKKRYPNMRISETAVRRVLAEFRPRKSKNILRFERSTVTEMELPKLYWIQKMIQAYWHDKVWHDEDWHDKELIWSMLPQFRPTKPVVIYKIRLGVRPDYPRKNRKPCTE